MGYRFPKYKDIKNNVATFHGAKLCEEAGEVCQAIIKPDKTPEDVINEVMDVMQVLESILWYYDVTDGMYDEAIRQHIEYTRNRGYYAEEDAWC